MAYGVRYRLSFCNSEGTPIRLDIEKNGYSGAISNVEGSGNPINLRGVNDKRKDGDIITGELSFEIRENDNFLYQDIQTSDEREYKVKLYINNALEWTGFLLPDIFTREVTGYPIIELSAIDCLGTIKDVPYLSPSNTPYTGRQNFLTVVLNCLKSTDLDLNLSVICDITCDEWVADGSRTLNYLEDTYIDSERFSDANGNVLSKYDLLKAILHQSNARLVQHSGRWWFENWEQLQLGQGYIDTFTPVGVRVGSRVPYLPQVINIDSVFKGGFEDNEPARGLIETYSEHGRALPLPKNNTFSGYNSGTYPNWTNVNGFSVENTNIDVRRFNTSDGTILESVILDRYFTKLRSVAKTNIILPNKVLLLDTVPYMVSDPMQVFSRDDKITISIGLKGYYDDPSYMVVQYILEGKEYLLNPDGSWYDRTAGGDISGGTKSYITLNLPKPANAGSTRDNTVSKVFTITGNPVPNIERSGGQLRIRIYGHSLATNNEGTATSGDRWQLTLRSLDVEVGDDSIRPKGLIYRTNNAGKFSKKSDTNAVLFSDKVSQVRGTGFFTVVNEDLTSLLRNKNGIPTSAWRSFGQSLIDYQLVHIALQKARTYAKAAKVFNVTFDGQKCFVNAKYDLQCAGVGMNAVSWEIDVLNAQVKAELIAPNTASRGNNVDIVSPLESDKNSGLSPIGSGSGSGGGSAPQDLQSVTDVGSTTTNIIEARGLRALDLLQLPDNEPPLADRRAGKTYLYANGDGSGSDPAPSMGNLEDLQNVADIIANGKYLQKINGVWQGVDLNLPDLSGYATQSWVTIQLGSYVPTTRTINGKPLSANITLSAGDVGALSETTADGKYVTIATKQTVTGAKHFSGAIGLPNVAPTVAQREAGVTYLYSNGDGSGSTPPPILGNLEDLQNVANTIANGKYLQKVAGVWTGVDISFPSLAGYALESWVTTGFEPKFTKNTAFNRNFGSIAGSVAQGNDDRINNGQTAYGWGNHANRYPLYNGTGATGIWPINISGQSSDTLHSITSRGATTTNNITVHGVISNSFIPVGSEGIELQTPFSGGLSAIGGGFGLHVSTAPSSGNTYFQSKDSASKIAYDLSMQSRGGGLAIGLDSLNKWAKFQVGRQGGVPLEGTISVTNGSFWAIGTNTRFSNDFKDRQRINLTGYGWFYVALPSDPLTRDTQMVLYTDAALTIPYVWPWTSLNGLSYTSDTNVALSVSSHGDVIVGDKLIAPSIRATSALAIPNGAPPVAMREAGVTYIYAI